MRRLALAAGYVWAAPTTMACALLFLFPLWALSQVRPGGWRDGAWEWTVRPGSRWWRWYSRDGEWAATTLGWCILLSPEAAGDVSTALHERRHMMQNLVLGPLFMPLYGVLWAMFGYSRHPLEGDARRHASLAQITPRGNGGGQGRSTRARRATPRGPAGLVPSPARGLPPPGRT